MNPKMIRTLFAEQMLRTLPALLAGLVVGSIFLIANLREQYFLVAHRDLSGLVQVLSISIAALGLIYSQYSPDEMTCGIPRSTLLLPVSSATIILSRFGWNAVGVGTLSGVLSILTNILLPTTIDSWWGNASIALMSFFIVQTLALALSPFGDWSIAGLVAAALILVTTPFLRNSTDPGSVLFIVPAILALCSLASWGIVSTQRRGLWNISTRITHSESVPRAAISETPLGSPLAAQIWFETARVLPLFLRFFTVVFLATSAVEIVANLREGKNWTEIVGAYLDDAAKIAVTCSIIASGVSGAVMAFQNFRSQLGASREFFFLRPMSARDLATARLRSYLKVLTAPMVIVTALTIVATAHEVYQRYLDNASRTDVSQAEIIEMVVGGIVPFALRGWSQLVGGLLFGTWALLWLTLDVVTMAIVMFSGSVLQLINPVNNIAIDTLYAVIFSLMLGGLVLFTRRKLTDNRLLLAVFTIGLFFGLTTFILADWANRHIVFPADSGQHAVAGLALFRQLAPTYIAGFAYFLIPFATIPLTLHWARHR